MSSKVSSPTSSSNQKLNVSQAAKLLGKGEASVRRWIQQFGIPTTTEGGQNLLSSDMLQVLTQIKELRARKMRSEDIELNVSDAIQEEQELLDHVTQQRSDGSSGIERRMISELTEALAEHNEALARSVGSAVQQASKMADRYAESQRELGRMEAMMQAMQYQLQEAEQKARLLPEKAQALQEQERQARQLTERLDKTRQELRSFESEHKDLSRKLKQEQNERLKLEQEKKELQEKLEQLENNLNEKENINQNLSLELEQEKKKSWWDKFKGKA